jgi:hypothetical protein
MKRSILAAFGAVAIAATVGSAMKPAAVQEVTATDYNAICLEAGILNANQIGNGFYCLGTTTDVSREIGGGSRCQDAQQITVQAYNHRGNMMEDKTLEIGEVEWGPSYSKVGSCNHPLI